MNKFEEFLRDMLNLRENESVSEFGLLFALTVVAFTGILLYVWFM